MLRIQNGETNPHLIDTYNHDLYRGDARSSVLEQDFPSSDVEILVVDDGSTDDTSRIVAGSLRA